MTASRRTSSAFWGPPLFYAVVTLAMTWPLVTHLQTAVMGGVGDNWFCVWLIDWVQYALGHGRNPIFVSWMNSPDGWNLAYTDVMAAQVLPALAVSWLGGPVLAYNVLLLSSFVLSGWVVHRWVWRLTGDASAALLAGMLFAFAPYRLAHAYGHLPLMGTQWLALNCAGFCFVLLDPVPRTKHAVLAGIGWGLAALSSMYYLYMSAVVMVALLVVYGLFLERRPDEWRRRLMLLIVMVSSAVPFLLLAVAPYVYLIARGETHHLSILEVNHWSASPTDFFIPSADQFLWGPALAQHFQRTLFVEQTLYLGVVTIGLFMLLVYWHRSAPLWDKWLRLLAGGAFITAVLAMGMTLHWFENMARLPNPGFLRTVYAKDAVPIPLPGAVLFLVVPFYDGMRVWMRYGIYVGLFATVLAGMGYALLAARVQSHRLRHALLPICIALTFVDFYPGPVMLSTLDPRPVDRWLATQPDEGAVAFFPSSLNTSIVETHATRFHRKPLIGMFYGAYEPAGYTQMKPQLEKFPDADALLALRARQVSYVLVSPSYYPNPVTRRQMEVNGLRLLKVFDDYDVYQFSKPAAPPL